MPSRSTLELAIREARADDAEQIAALLGELGYPTMPEQFAARFAHLDRDPAVWLFVAEARARVVGLAGLRVLALVERDEPVGRLIALVVGEDVRAWASDGRSSSTSRSVPATPAASSST